MPPPDSTLVWLYHLSFRALIGSTPGDILEVAALGTVQPVFGVQ